VLEEELDARHSVERAIDATDIVPGAATDQVAEPVPGEQAIVLGTPAEDVASGAAEEHIFSAHAVDEITTRAAEEAIGTWAAVEDIVAAGSDERVVSPHAAQAFGPSSPINVSANRVLVTSSRGKAAGQDMTEGRVDRRQPNDALVEECLRLTE
jgi:hypothetical protein